MLSHTDAYNKEYEKIEGMILIRGEAIPDGFYHLASDVIVKHVDGTYLLMQRDIRKHFGGMWEATAGGFSIERRRFSCLRHQITARRNRNRI